MWAVHADQRVHSTVAARTSHRSSYTTRRISWCHLGVAATCGRVTHGNPSHRHDPCCYPRMVPGQRPQRWIHPAGRGPVSCVVAVALAVL